MDSVNHGLLGWLRGTLATARVRTETDADLLVQFVRTRDEAAFRELVRRLGPMVLGVCRRHLNNTTDADDAFQTAFLVLARKAETVCPAGSVAAWMYGVASLAARKLQQARQRRRLREVATPQLPDCPAPEREMDAELLSVIDEELEQLPEGFRLPIVLCGLRGLTIALAARELGWPAGAVATRLRRGRAVLRERLAKRGFLLAALAATAGGWSELTAGVPARLIAQTMAATIGGTVSPVVATLTSEVVDTMMWISLRRFGVGLVVLVSMALAGGGIIATGMAAAPQAALTASDSSSAPGNATSALDRLEWDKVPGLLRQESVRKEIGLSEEDYKTLARFRKERRADLKKQFEAGLKAAGQQNEGGLVQKTTNQPEGADPVNAAVAELLDQYLKDVRELEVEVGKRATDAITPAGVKRLKQVVLQAAGPRGLLDRVTIRELQLTAEQEDKIAALVGPAKPAISFVLPNAWLIKAAKEKDAAMQAALNLLTAEQRKRWDALVGKPLPTVDLLKADPMSGESIAELEGD